MLEYLLTMEDLEKFVTARASFRCPDYLAVVAVDNGYDVTPTETLGISTCTPMYAYVDSERVYYTGSQSKFVVAIVKQAHETKAKSIKLPECTPACVASIVAMVLGGEVQYNDALNAYYIEIPNKR
jgi:hypothetical protein